MGVSEVVVSGSLGPIGGKEESSIRVGQRGGARRGEGGAGRDAGTEMSSGRTKVEN